MVITELHIVMRETTWMYRENAVSSFVCCPVWLTAESDLPFQQSLLSCSVPPERRCSISQVALPIPCFLL